MYAISSCSEYQRYQLLRAIHNQPNPENFLEGVVPNIKDINFWEQFTTRVQITNFLNCCSEYQRYQLLRAIHNGFRGDDGFIIVVPNIKDINFWEQFTTRLEHIATSPWLFRISKISTFESNSQQGAACGSVSKCCSEYQRYQLLRAIHNVYWRLHSLLIVVPNIKDINFWEQFTTKSGTGFCVGWLFRISKISTFESNSQPTSQRDATTGSCSEYQRYQLLRAIHNLCSQRYKTS